MNLYFASRTMDILGTASTGLPDTPVISEDLKTEDVESGVAAFSCKVGYADATRLLVRAWTEAGNYLLRGNGGENEFYTIIETEEDTGTQEIYIYAEDAGMDLLNEVYKSSSSDTEYSAREYVENSINDTGFEIGTDESDSTVKKKLSFEEQTASARILYIMEQFGYEVSYSFAISGLQVTHKYINIHKQRGEDSGVQLRLGQDIDSIVIKKSVANLATALLCTGSAGTDGVNISFAHPETYSYDDGDFYISGHYLRSRSALAKWSRYVWENEPNQQEGYTGNIIRTFTYDTVSQEELCTQAIAELKTLCEPEVNYEADISHLPDGVSVGDTVNVVDEKGELYLSARILKLETSICDGTRKATLGDYLIQSSGINEKVQELASEFSKIAENRQLYTWVAYADDTDGSNISVEAGDRAYMGTATNRFSETPDLSDPSVFTWVKVKGETGEKGEDTTFLYIGSSKGTVFKNDNISTTLVVTIYRGTDCITDMATLKEKMGDSVSLQWSFLRPGEDTYYQIDAGDSRIGDDGFTFSISPDDVDTSATFVCELIEEEGE